MELARLLCNRSGAALTQIMRCVDDADDVPLAEGLAREGRAGQRAVRRPEAREGLSAFIQKRRPDYA